MTPFVHLLAVLIAPAAPLVIAALVLHKRNDAVVQTLAALAALPALMTSVLTPSGLTVTLPWLLEGSVIGLDETGRTMLFFSSAIWLGAGVYARHAIAGAARDRFFAFLLLAMSGNLGLIVAQDMLSFYLFFTLMSLAAYGLIVHDGNERSRRAGRVYLTLVVAGDMMLYAGLVYAALDTDGVLRFAAVREAIAASSERDLIVALLVAGFGVKAGLLGLHVALPLIYAAAPAPAAAALAGALLNAGLLGWLRLLPMGAEASAWGTILIAFGAAAAVYGVLAGIPQRATTVVLAYSSISQMGIMTAGVGAALRAPAYAAEIAAAVVLYAMHHAFAKGALFLGVGAAALEPARGARALGARLGLILPAIALTGAPFTSGMLAKTRLEETLSATEDPWATELAHLLPWAAVLTTLIVARFAWLAWPLPARARPAATGPLPAVAWIGLLILSSLAVWLMPFDAASDVLTPTKLGQALWPPVVGGAISVAGWRIARGYRTTRPHRVGGHHQVAHRHAVLPRIPAGDVVVAAGRAGQWMLAVWMLFAARTLPALRATLRKPVRSLFRSPVWPRAAAAIEHALGQWSVAVMLFIALSLLFMLLT